MTLKVFDAAGRLVETLVNERVNPGDHFRMWDGTDHRGSRVASGIYFYELIVNGQRQTRKLVQVR